MDEDKNVHLDAILRVVRGGDAEAISAYRVKYSPVYER